jgi:tripartite-type tricarboxylate transporter receptor subunit TctC
MRELFAKPSRFMAITAAVAAAVLCPGLVLAQSATFPTKAIRLVVPFPAGGGTDTMARTLGDLLSKDLGQTVVIENKAGAGTVIGNDFVAKSAPDGHTLLINTNAFAAVVALHAKLPYGGENAFSAVTLLGRGGGECGQFAQVRR